MEASGAGAMTDVLRWPVVGAVLRWRHLRTATQTLLGLVALAVVLHGLLGPPFAPLNLATLGTWIHYRGLLIGVLLVAGNAFCHACPMIKARDLARRVHAPRLRWPRALRGKWLAIPLFAAVLFAYELFDLWAQPAATAWLIIGYFAGAILVDTAFTGATFCKHVCPVGQFNFIASTLSPLEIRARDQGICASCQTVDCLKGRRSQTIPGLAPSRDGGAFVVHPSHPLGPDRSDHHMVGTTIPGWAPSRDGANPGMVEGPGKMVEGPGKMVEGPGQRVEGPGKVGGLRFQRGCELQLFVPRKTGNLECTFCFDCVQACPYDNVALAVRIPGEELVDDRRRSLIGRLSMRPDLAALALVFTFGAFVNAFAMTAPVYGVEAVIAWTLGTAREWPALLLIFAAGLITLPLVACGTAAIGTFLASDRTRTVRTIAVSYAYALVPLGAGLWLAHYGFHFLTGLGTIVPVTQRAALDAVGHAVLGEPTWGWLGLKPGQVFPLQIGAVLLGALGSAILIQQVSDRDHADRALAAAAPWMLLLAALTGAALWILSQPMDMRGTGFLS
jgi:ferredoxin